MICRQCMRAASRPQSSYAPSFRAGALAILPRRQLSTTAPLLNAGAPNAPAAGEQPASKEVAKKPRATPANAAISISSVPAGTPLKGLNFIKGKNDPVAKEDHEYPSWLWGILKKEEKKGDDAAEGDLFAKSKKQRRLANKRLRKQQLLNPDQFAPKVPIYEQSIDLPAGDGSIEGSIKADQAREELTKAMRAKRRSQIKESNFLKEMS